MTDLKDNKEATILLAITLATLIIISGIDGWVLKWLWLWFVVPTTHRAPITAFQGAGLDLVARLFRYQYKEETNDEQSEKRSSAFNLPSIFRIM